MKKRYPCRTLSVLAIALGTALCVSAASPGNSLAASSGNPPAPSPANPSAPTDLDQYLLTHTTVEGTVRSLPIDRSEVNEHALNGYFTYTFQDGNMAGRSFKLYAGRHAALRAYITVIAVPDGVGDTYDFLEEQGWTEQADTYGELLFILEPGAAGWGTPESESSYLEACLGETVGNTNFNTRATKPGGIVQSGKIPVSDGTTCAVFTGHSCNYYVGYGDGCAVLESWTAENPLYVISQAFVGGKSVGQECLKLASARTYNGINTGSYYPGFDDASFSATLQTMKKDGAIKDSRFITNADIPVPTLLAGYAADDASIAYWSGVNDAIPVPQENGLFRQDIDSDAWQTAYANQNAMRWEPGTLYGISKVQTLESGDIKAVQIRDFLADYTRYTNPLAYSNSLAYRLDYYKATEAARTAAESGKAIAAYSYTNYKGASAQVELRALEQARVSVPGSSTGGTVYSCISAFNDYDADGGLDPRESLIYIPDSARNVGAEGAPVVVVFPGSTQAASTFMDCSGWWAVANDEGCVVVIVGQFCKTSASGLAYGDEADNADFARSALVLMDQVISKRAEVTLDFTRVYGSGHSAGCNAIQTLCNNTEAYYFAAVAATSFPNPKFSADQMPCYLIVGQSDISEPLPDTRARDLVKDPWDTAADSAIYNWTTGAQRMNGLEVSFTPNDHASFLAACSSYDESGRYYTYTWNNSGNVPMVQFTRTLAREHNCYPEEFRLAWDFLKNYRLAQDGTRYYSPSAFEQNDVMGIFKN